MSEALIVRRGGSGGGGAGGLNFTVKQYASTPTGTAAENTIGVVTDTAISGWIMQAEEPTGTEGLVWIEVAAESNVPFFADKKQFVKVYPVAVKQYVNGAWVNCEAYAYQNGWSQFSYTFIDLYNGGTKFVSFTGGYNGYDAGSLSWGSESCHIECISTASAGTNTRFSYTNAMDLSPYTTLHIDYEGVTNARSSRAYLVVGVSSASAPKINDDGTISNSLAVNTLSVKGLTNASGTLSVDISDVDNTASVIFGLTINGAGISSNINSVADVTRVYFS